MNMLERMGRSIDRLDQVEEDVGVCRHRLARIRALRDREIEQMRDIVERSELCFAIGGVEKIGSDVPVVTGNPRLAARNRYDIPAALLKQMIQHVAAGQAGSTCDKCGTLRHRHLFSPLSDARSGSSRNFASN